MLRGIGGGEGKVSTYKLQRKNKLKVVRNRMGKFKLYLQSESNKSLRADREDSWIVVFKNEPH